MYQIPDTFFEDLQAYELIPTQQETGMPAIDENHLPELEKIMRLHFDLHINMEGIDVIYRLLSQIEALQNENNDLKNRLCIYENL